MPCIAIGFRNSNLVPRNMEGRSIPSVRSFYFDQTLATVRLIAKNVIACAIPVFDRGPANFIGEIGSVCGSQKGLLVQEDSLFTCFSKRTVSRVALGNIVLSRHCGSKLRIDWWRLVGISWRRPDPEDRVRAVLYHIRSLLFERTMFCHSPFGVDIKPTDHSIHQGALITVKRFVALDLLLPEEVHDGADIAVFEFESGIVPLWK